MGKTKYWLSICLCGLFFAVFSVFSAPNTYAKPITPTLIEKEDSSRQQKEAKKQVSDQETKEAKEAKTPETKQSSTDKPTESTNVCQDQASALGWFICPNTGVMAKAIDAIYNIISGFLTIDPISTNHDSPIRIIWEFARNITNIVFIIFILIIIYSHLTGLGLSNYHIKRTLPRIVIAAILVNLSFIICSIAVDISNIIGSSLHGFFNSIQENFIAKVPSNHNIKFSFSDLFLALTGSGATLWFLTGLSGGLGSLFWLLLPVVVGSLLSIIVGLITISLRQALVALLIMVSPLAFVAYLLPNTEQYFNKWRKLFTQMLVFYPIFSLLFSASQLAGLTIIISAKNAFYIILGMAVQIFPLFFSINLMKMSGTVLGNVSNKLSQFSNRPRGAIIAASIGRREEAKAKHLASSRGPGAALRNYMDYRATLRSEHLADHQKINTARINQRVQKKLSSGRTVTTPGLTRANKYTRTRKIASNLELASATTTQDTENILNNYGENYKETGAVRENNFEQLQHGSLSQQGAYNWVNYNRAMFNKVSNDEADFNYLVDQYIKFAKEGVNSAAYKKYHVSAAGGLGPKGAETVFGQLIAKAAAVETRQRRDTNILHNKFGYDQKPIRSMIVGHYVTPDGFAADKNYNRLVDENGNYLENYVGELIQKHPEKLVLWDKVDPELGAYNDIYDKNDGKFVMRVYKNDSPYVKEVLSNFDMSINDPINRYYAVLSGVKPGSVGDGDPQFKDIGLSKFSTTIGRSLLANSFKEKSAGFTPYLASMVSKGLIKNGEQLIAAELMSLNASASPSIIRTQDKNAFKTLAYYIKQSQEDISKLFSKKGIADFEDVLGNPLDGIDYDENGKKLEIPAAEATYQQKLNKLRSVVDKSCKVLENSFENYNFNTADKLKMGAAEEAMKLINLIKNHTDLDGKTTPFDQSTDILNAAKDLKIERKNRQLNQSTQNLDQTISALDSVATEIESLYRTTTNREDFTQSVIETLDRYGLHKASLDFKNHSEIFLSDSIDQLYHALLTDILG